MSATFTLVHAKIKTKVLITRSGLNPFSRMARLSCNHQVHFWLHWTNVQQKVQTLYSGTKVGTGSLCTRVFRWWFCWPITSCYTPFAKMSSADGAKWTKDNLGTQCGQSTILWSVNAPNEKRTRHLLYLVCVACVSARARWQCSRSKFHAITRGKTLATQASLFLKLHFQDRCRKVTSIWTVLVLRQDKN